MGGVELSVVLVAAFVVTVGHGLVLVVATMALWDGSEAGRVLAVLWASLVLVGGAVVLSLSSSLRSTGAALLVLGLLVLALTCVPETRRFCRSAGSA